MVEKKSLDRLTVLIFISLVVGLLLLVLPRSANLDHIKYLFFNGAGFNSQFLVPGTIDNYKDPEIPAIVHDAASKKLKIKVIFTQDPTHTPQSYDLNSINGTGFAIERFNGNLRGKIVITARHVIFGDRPEPFPKSPLSVSSDGLNSVGDYQYRIYATYGGKQYVLSQIGNGEYNTHNDFAAFKVLDPDNNLPTLNLGKNASLGDIVYTCGFGGQPSPFRKGAMFDIIEGPLPAVIYGIITDKSLNNFFSKKTYRVRGPIEYGFSGGPTLNANGNVIGITVMSSGMHNFAFIISAEDMDNFLRSLGLN